ncbi:MAG: carbamoyltransferase HypF [Candidatus Methanoplasma sp.]|jgi:hydrogenase maturation protein HypF|nr:carbamoyltransferase HypF [Candidatus Methanoplasma sp.]
MRIIVCGTVQGVGFRPAVYRTAVSLGLRGRVRNNGPDVVIDVDDGEEFLRKFHQNIPPLASITSIEKIDTTFDESIDDFRIVSSERGAGGVSIPTDTAVCDKCLNDMRSGRRKGYPFTSCTDCGPRFTLLSGMPYDRALTSMEKFPVCEECGREYNDPDNRRFHHQTVCCKTCGPSYRIYDKSGKKIDGDPIKTFSRMLEDGRIGVVKGWGGMHICCTLENTARMREWYGRKQKPFAVMVRDISAVKNYGYADNEELAHLTSVHRPIVLINKKSNNITDLISPELDNIGVFLPYTGMHHLLFDELKDDALIMTSANIPGEPMILDDSEILKLGADVYLLHDQPIINRADDSVLRVNDGKTLFIRRSRGHIPSGIHIGLEGCTVGVGAQENLTGAISSRGIIYPTQHIGDGDGIGVPEYLESAIRSQLSLLDCKPQAVAVDLHPGCSNRRFAKRLAEEYNAEFIEVQHHWAHAASLIADNAVSRTSGLIALALDGNGHGDDGNSWGGEVLSADLSSYKRKAHLEYIPLLGSEKALYDLRRLKFAIDSMNGIENHDFTDSESAVLSKLMSKSVKSSSMGRLMDALSYTLGVCTTRTYDGEPAMKLEPLLASGKLIPGFETGTENGVVKTVELFSRITNDQKPADVAYSIIYNVIKELVTNAIDVSESDGMDDIGITGGVSYNGPVCKMFSELASNSEHHLIFHRDAPNGDGGISVGQAAIALNKLGLK